ncbi:MAG TPA: hypothetical protein DD426_06235 [Clostridiaceae bacterium]|nr:hypothetical protein [Clostridiaceae bacterium]
MKGIWIRTQDRQGLVYAIQFFMYSCNGKYDFDCTSSCGDVQEIGRYGTVERALEILDCIQDRICTINADKLHCICTAGNGDKPVPNHFVFEMPNE